MNDSERRALAKAVAELRRLKAENAALLSAGDDETICVIGMSCRFPGGCDTPDAYWNLLREGRSGVSEVPAYRWPVDAYYDPAAAVPGKLNCRYGGFLGPVEDFDCTFFGISPMEASVMDPHQRLLLEMAWEALEDAHIVPAAVRGSETGIYIGLSSVDYAVHQLQAERYGSMTAHVGSGCVLSPAAGRISYFLGAQGPAYVVDTACSSALVALHGACSGLFRRECDLALVGAANFVLNPSMTINFSQAGLLSSDGKTRAFDANCSGYVRSEGGGMVVLKRLSDAQRDGDRIDAMILGTAMNQDGASNGLMAPNGRAQERVIQAALKRAGITPSDVDVLEAHGTATELGDPIEMTSVGEVFKDRGEGAPLWVGSAKTNLGHMEAAAGMGSLIKTILALKHAYWPAHLHFNQGSSLIDWDAYPVEIIPEGCPWPTGARRRVAGINAFGFAGTNVHVVVAEGVAASQPSPFSEEGPEALLVSARTDRALDELVAKYAAAVPNNWRTFCRAARGGRARFSHRFWCVASSREQLVSRLTQYVEKGKRRGIRVGKVGKSAPKVAFVFGGHGSQYVGMGHILYQENLVFQAAVDRCCQAVIDGGGADLRLLMFAEPGSNASQPTNLLDPGEDEASLLHKTEYAQPAIFAVQYGLAQVWMEQGIEPSLVLGHSLGEYTAAALAGVMSPEDAIRLIAFRAKRMVEGTPEGRMISVFADVDVVQRMLRGLESEAAVAAENGPEIVLVSGSVPAVSQLVECLDGEGLRYTPVRIERAFHSPLTEPILTDMAEALAMVSLSKPTIPILSNVTGEFVDADMATSEYWCRQLREPVQFCRSVTRLHEQQLDVLIDVSPDPVMMGLDLCFAEVRGHTGSQAIWVASMKKGADDRETLLQALGPFVSQSDEAQVPDAGNRSSWTPVRSPTYAFDRRRCWADTNPSVTEPPEPCRELDSPVVTPVVASSSMEQVMMTHLELMERYLDVADSDAVPNQTPVGVGVTGL